jgi:hypothetical protein
MGISPLMIPDNRTVNPLYFMKQGEKAMSRFLMRLRRLCSISAYVFDHPLSLVRWIFAWSKADGLREQK